jgi:hypothetical protein
MAAAGFLALAHTFKKNEHIRVTLLMNAVRGRQAGAGAVGAVRRRAAVRPVRFLQHASWPGNRWDFHDISTGNDATPLWIPADRPWRWARWCC